MAKNESTTEAMKVDGCPKTRKGHRKSSTSDPQTIRDPRERKGHCPQHPNLRRAYEARRMTKEQFATLMDVTPRTIDRWLNGYDHMSNRDLVKSSLLLGVSVFYLLDLTIDASLPRQRDHSMPCDTDGFTQMRLDLIKAVKRIKDPDGLLRHKEDVDYDETTGNCSVTEYVEVDVPVFDAVLNQVKWESREYVEKSYSSFHEILGVLSEWDEERVIEEYGDFGNLIDARLLSEHEYAQKVAEGAWRLLDSIEGDYRDLLEVAICVLRYTAEIDDPYITDILSYDVVAASQRLAFLPDSEYKRDFDEL